LSSDKRGCVMKKMNALASQLPRDVENYFGTLDIKIKLALVEL